MKHHEPSIIQGDEYGYAERRPEFGHGKKRLHAFQRADLYVQLAVPLNDFRDTIALDGALNPGQDPVLIHVEKEQMLQSGPLIFS